MDAVTTKVSEIFDFIEKELTKRDENVFGMMDDKQIFLLDDSTKSGNITYRKHLINGDYVCDIHIHYYLTDESHRKL